MRFTVLRIGAFTVTGQYILTVLFGFRMVKAISKTFVDIKRGWYVFSEQLRVLEPTWFIG